MTSAGITALILVAGGLGAAARFVIDGLIRARTATAYPIATNLINLSGSLLLGFLVGLATARSDGAATWELIAGTGFLGGYTTFSTASFETVRLIEQRRWRAALANGPGQLAAAIALAALGYTAGAALPL